ncbi:hypothetical protein AB4Y36_19430 [Paraburkholderia sp. BR10936]|uniref:hypothetical protein n=1 Tax=Paraburkholderia sp. BR10936 TaxID=3236993 RepID=UPI0034D224A7
MLLTLLAIAAAYVGLIAWLDCRQREEARLQYERVLKDFRLQSGWNYLLTGYCYRDGDYLSYGDVYRKDGTQVQPKRPGRAERRRFRSHVRA